MSATRLQPGSQLSSKVMVVDDDLTNRLILKTYLGNIGYLVIEARDGVEAIERFISDRPDVVFMDVMMPRMDGYKATARIKELAGETFVPVIFLTALTDDQALVRCIEVGGDDFLTKPFSHVILRSKIQAMERIRGLHAQVNSLYNQMRQDEELAEVVFSTAVLAGNVGMDKIPHRLQSADIFSGDILLSARTPSGDLHLMLGDFTGHGLSAALGALPTAEAFRTMTAKGFSPAQILTTINRKLHAMLPTGMFLAAFFVRLPVGMEYVEVCNCGLPDGLLLNAVGHELRERISSDMLPLGILHDQDMDRGLQNFSISEGDRLLLSSDGVVEARGPDGGMYGWQRLEQAIRDSSGEYGVLQAINDSLNAFCAGAKQADDISLVELPCESTLFASTPVTLDAVSQRGQIQAVTLPSVPGQVRQEWATSMALRGPRLGKMDPVPLLINQLRELEGEQVNHQCLYTIMTELFVNALDHGVLQLDSTIKSDAEGFGRYFEEREQRLKTLVSGEISMSLICEQRDGQRVLRIRVEDSGSGFDYHNEAKGPGDNPLQLHGRGIHLLNSLCLSLQYSGSGNVVEAMYLLEA